MLTRNELGKLRVGFDGDLIDVKTTIETIARMAAMVELTDAQALVQHYNQIETLGPIFDPTAYMDIGDNLRGHKKLAHAFAAFRQAIEEMR